MEEEKEIKKEESPTEVVNNVPPVKKNTGLIAILIIIILLMSAVLVYLLFFNKEKDSQKDNNDVIEVTPAPQKTKEPQDTEVPSGDYELNVYKNKETSELSKASKKDEYLTEAFTIKVNNKNAKVVAVSFINDNCVLYDDGGLYIYNHETKKSQKINLENTYKEYAIYLDEDNSKVIGIGYIDKNDKYGYYNVSKGAKLYNGKYKVDSIWNASQINDYYLSLTSGTMIYLLSTDSEIAKLSYKDTAAESDSMYAYESFGENGKYVYALGFMSEPTMIYERLYSNNFEMFYETKNGFVLDEEMISFKDYLYFAEGNYETGFNKLLKYNVNGDLISSNTDYTNIKMISNGYIVYVKDDELILENLEDSNESKTITKWDKSWTFNGMDSGYYDRLTLDRLGEKNKNEGFYIVVEYEKKDSNGNYGMEYCYTPSQELVKYPIKHEIGGRAKPVLYLYPEKETNVIVTFAHPEYLTTTYPKYINSWNVTVSPNGDMRDKDGKYYYALYWDEKRYNEVDFSSGFYVEGKDAIKFLEEKLTYIGLNDKERNEFIMYWLPIMEANGKNLVYFELTSEREAGNKLIIEPKPDSLLRISIHIKRVNQKVNIKEQKLETFNRTGFAAIEWGGMTY